MESGENLTHDSHMKTAPPPYTQSEPSYSMQDLKIPAQTMDTHQAFSQQPPQMYAQQSYQIQAQPAPQMHIQQTPQINVQQPPQMYAQPAPQMYAQPAPQMYAQPAPQIHVIQQGGGFVSVGPKSVRTKCPNCRADVQTKTNFSYKGSAHLWCLCLTLVGCWLCCCIPYCMDSYKDVEHSCPNCNARIGSWSG